MAITGYLKNEEQQISVNNESLYNDILEIGVR